MTSHHTSPLPIACLSAPASDSMTGLTIIDVFAADPAAIGTANGPAWIKITPRGAFTSRDGRSLDTDPELLASRFAAEGVALPIDIDHATVKKAMFGDAAPAVGWIEKLEARPDGLYGQVTWLDEGLRVLTARTHRYISPALKAGDDGKAIWLHSAALVAAPGISMPSVASADPLIKTENTMLKIIAQALGLAPEAAETSCLSAIEGLKARVDPAVHKQALDLLAAKTAELDTIGAAARKSKVDALLEGALKAKKITPAQRESYELLCASDDGLVQVTKLIETLGTGLSASGLDNKTVPDGVYTLSAEDREVMTQMGLTEDQYRKANGLAAAT